MGEVRFFSTTALKAIVAQLGILAVLVLPSPHVIHGQQHPSVSELLRQFEDERVFWRQCEVAKGIVAANDTSVLPQLESWLTHEDRHLRGNAAFVFARLGDARGFDVISAILRDHSERPEGQGIPGGRWSLKDKSGPTVIMPPTYWAT
jgi:hypothetical protein